MSRDPRAGKGKGGSGRAGRGMTTQDLLDAGLSRILAGARAKMGEGMLLANLAAIVLDDDRGTLEFKVGSVDVILRTLREDFETPPQKTIATFSEPWVAGSLRVVGKSTIDGWSTHWVTLNVSKGGKA
jgi:hypothetical protein